MQTWNRFRPKGLYLFIAGGVLTILLAVACGAAAPPAPKAPEAAKPAAPAAQPVAPAAPAAAPKATPVPAPTPTPAPVVHPGKVILMVGYMGTERFDAIFGAVGKEYHKAFHGHLVTWDKFDGRMVIVPGVASKWELSNDGKTTTYTIRKGVKFHNGKELTAEDVFWSFQHFMGPQARGYSKNSVSINYSTLMDKIEQTGPDQVSVTTKVPSPELAIYASENEGGVSGGVVMPRRSKLGDMEEASAYDKNPIGAGLIKLVKHIPEASMTFERFDDFYYQPKNGLPSDKRLNFRQLDMRLIPEEATRVAALRAGEADIGRISLATRGQVEAGGGRLVFGPEAVLIESHLWGCFKPQIPCQDKRARQALSYAIDRKLMQEKLYGGPSVMAIKGWWVVTPSTIGYSPDLDPHPFDPNKARQLLADAGYPGGKNFGKLVINTYEDPLVPFLSNAAQLTADLWKRELGLDVEVVVMDKVKFGQIRTLTPRDFDGQVTWAAQNTRLDAAGITRLYYLTPVKGETASRMHNTPELFALVAQTLAVTGQPGSEKAFNSLFRQLREEAYQIPMGYINAPWGVGPRIVKWEPFPVAEYASALHTITLK